MTGSSEPKTMPSLSRTEAVIIVALALLLVMLVRASL